MRSNLAHSLVLAGSLLFCQTVSAGDLKVGDKMPVPRGISIIPSHIELTDVYDIHKRTAFVVDYTSGDTALYLGCDGENVDDVVKEKPFGVYVANGDMHTLYIDNNGFPDGHIDKISKRDIDDYEKPFDIAPYCDGDKLNRA